MGGNGRCLPNIPCLLITAAGEVCVPLCKRQIAVDEPAIRRSQMKRRQLLVLNRFGLLETIPRLVELTDLQIAVRQRDERIGRFRILWPFGLQNRQAVGQQGRRLGNIANLHLMRCQIEQALPDVGMIGGKLLLPNGQRFL